MVVSIRGVDLSILSAAVQDKLKEELTIPDRLKHLSNKLCENEALLKAIIMTHRDLFISIYNDCKKAQSHT